MKHSFSTLFFLLIAVTASAQSDKILGTWLTADKKAHVEMYKSNDIYYGKIIWLQQPNDPTTGKPKLDSKNPDAAKRSQAILGSIIFYNFKYKDGEYSGGKIYDCRDGQIYTGKLWVNADGTLSMRGYIGFLYSTETWTRVK